MKQYPLPPRAPAEKVYGTSILRVATQFHHIDDTERIADVAGIFETWPEIHALGLVDSRGRSAGICSRLHLFSLLGKPFGRDLLAKKPVGDIREQVPSFDVHGNIFQVASTLEQTIALGVQNWFMLQGPDGSFKGLFSSRDLLVFLSRISREDIDLASALQDRMVKPDQVMEGKGFRAMALSRSAKGVGGDFHFHKDIGHGRQFFAVGDVSGKGVSASIITSLLWGILRLYDYRRGLKSLVHDINDALIHTFHLEKYLTGVFMILDTHKHQLRIADMGHGHIGILRRSKLRYLVFPQLNLPLGIEARIESKIYRVDVKAGDLIVAFTDGIAEQENRQGEEFGAKRLEHLVLESARRPQEIPLGLDAELLEWREDLPQHDDMTWLQVLVGARA